MRLTPPANSPLSIAGRYIAYPIGKISLKILTLGHYPPEDKKHNALFVAIFPWLAFLIVAGFTYS